MPDTQPQPTEKTVHVCQICGWTYDPTQGDPAKGVPPHTDFQQLRPDWTCYVCSAEKRDFRPKQVPCQP